MPNGQEPATKQHFDEAVKASEERVIKAMRDIQTEMLKAFNSFAESNRARLTGPDRPTQ